MTDERRATVAVAYFFALGGTAFGSWASRLADVKERIGASPGPLGAAMFCMAVGSLTSMLLTPRLIRRVGVPTVIVTGEAGICVFLIAVATAGSLGRLAASLFGLGLVSGGMAIALGMEAVALEQRAGRPVVARLHGCHSAGGLLGAGVGALLSAWVSPTAHLVPLAVGLLGGLLFMRRWLPGAQGVAVPAAAVAADEVSARLNRRLAAICVLAGLSAYGEGSVVSWAAVHLREELGAASGVAALGFAAQAAMMVTVRASGPLVFARRTPRQALRTAGAVAAAGALTVAIAPVPALAIAGCGLIGAGFALVYPTATAASSLSQRAARRGRRVPNDAIAVAVLCGTGAAVLSGPLGGLLAEVGGTRSVFVCIAFAGLAVSVLAARLPEAHPVPLGGPLDALDQAVARTPAEPVVVAAA